MNEKLEALNQEIEKTEKKLRWAQQEEKRLTHQAKALTRKERMLPFFLFAMYEKNGQPLEVFLGHLIQNKFIRPKVRIYQTNNLYSALVRQSQLEQEVKRIARKGRKTGKA